MAFINKKICQVCDSHTVGFVVFFSSVTQTNYFQVIKIVLSKVFTQSFHELLQIFIDWKVKGGYTIRDIFVGPKWHFGVKINITRKHV